MCIFKRTSYLNAFKHMLAYKQRFMHRQTHMHRCIQTCIQTFLHSSMLTGVPLYKHYADMVGVKKFVMPGVLPCWHDIHAHACIHTYIYHTYTHTYRERKRERERQIHTYTHTFKHTYIQTYIHHTRVQTYIHAHVCTIHESIRAMLCYAVFALLPVFVCARLFEFRVSVFVRVCLCVHSYRLVLYA